jgi:hypothetical protein
VIRLIEVATTGPRPVVAAETATPKPRGSSVRLRVLSLPPQAHAARAHLNRP